LNEAGQHAVGATAETVADLVDKLLEKRWSRREGRFIDEQTIGDVQSAKPVAGCACGSGIPVQTVTIDGKPVTLIALPPLMEQFRDAGKLPSPETTQELLAQVALYNPILAGEEAAYLEVLTHEYADFCGVLEAAP
jgi:hypothetical protein